MTRIDRTVSMTRIDRTVPMTRIDRTVPMTRFSLSKLPHLKRGTIEFLCDFTGLFSTLKFLLTKVL